jgi:hypothetical protein
VEQILSSTTFYSGMKQSIIPLNNKAKILAIAQHYLSTFHQLDMAEALTSERKRVKAVEYHLSRLVKSKRLTAVRDGKRLAYKYGGKRGNLKSKLRHDLACTQLILKFLARGEGEVVAERFFLESKDAFTLVPDWAVLLEDSVLLCEYSTADNCGRKRLMQKKIEQYQHNLPAFEDYFETLTLALFILDIPCYEVKRFVQAHDTGDIFYFTDLASFIATPKGKELEAPIYLWGGDNQTYSLRA